MNRMLRLIFFMSILVPWTSLAQNNFARKPYLSSVTQSSVNVSWRTKTASASAVVYGATIQYGSTVADNALVVEHRLTITGLLPFAQYHYRVISIDTTADYTFQTAVPPGQPFVFAAYGDTRTDHLNHIKVLRKLQQSSPRFAIHVGDLIESSTDAMWNAYFADLCDSTTVGETIPIFSAFGNHEGTPTLYYQNFALPHNNPDNSMGYYSFDYGDAHIVCLANYTIPYIIGSTQYTWLVNDLQSSTAKFKIVFMHMPPYSSGSHGKDSDVLNARNVLCPVFEQNKVALVFSGHDHDYERTIPMNGTTYIVTGGGGAPLYNPSTVNPWTAYKESAYEFCRVFVDSSACRVWMIRSDGAVKDSLTIFAPAIVQVVKDRKEAVIQHYNLTQCYPNPFNPSTQFEFNIPRQGLVSLKVIDILGCEVATLVNGVKPAGAYRVQWNAAHLSSGVYFYQLTAGSYRDVKKAMLLK